MLTDVAGHLGALKVSRFAANTKCVRVRRATVTLASFTLGFLFGACKLAPFRSFHFSFFARPEHERKADVAATGAIAVRNGFFNLPYGVANQNGTLYVTNCLSDAVDVYHLQEDGSSPVPTVISGNATGLSCPTGISVDSLGNMYVANLRTNSVTEYAANSTGDTGPVRVIRGTRTELSGPLALAIDADHAELFVANWLDNTVTGFVTNAHFDDHNENVRPRDVLKVCCRPSGLAVDRAGDVYVANFLTDAVTEFDRDKSTGRLTTGVELDLLDVNSLLNRPISIAVSPAGNLYVANWGNNSVVEYALSSQYMRGDYEHVRTLPGSGWGGISAVSVDTDHNLFIVSGKDVREYALGAKGDAAPVQTAGSLIEPIGICTRSLEFCVADPVQESILCYAHLNRLLSRTPLRIIAGARTALQEPMGVACGPSGQLYVANSGNNSITVYGEHARGDVGPVRTIAGRNTKLDRPVGVAVDSTGAIYVVNEGDNSVVRYHFGASGNAAPLARIAGSRSLLRQPLGIAVTDAGKILVVNHADKMITVYLASDSGNVAPRATIFGERTRLDRPTALAVDAAGDIYVTNLDGKVTEYHIGAAGDIAPFATISGPRSKLFAPRGIAVDSSGAVLVTNMTALGGYVALFAPP